MDHLLPVDWGLLPPVMRVRYGLHPHGTDRITVQGTLVIRLSRAGRALAPLLGLGGAFAPRGGAGILVRATLSADSGALLFNRSFLYPDGRTHRFRTRLLPGRRGEVHEMIRSGLGWCFRCNLQGKRLEFVHAGYVLRVGRSALRLPLEALIGRCTAVEEALDDDRYRMWMRLYHPLWGEIESYTGEFRVTGVRGR